MKQNNPLHPGAFILRAYIDSRSLSMGELAFKLGVPPEYVYILLHMKVDIDESWAIRLSEALGRSPESWLLMQKNYDSFNSSTNHS